LNLQTTFMRMVHEVPYSKKNDNQDILITLDLHKDLLGHSYIKLLKNPKSEDEIFNKKKLASALYAIFIDNVDVYVPLVKNLYHEDYTIEYYVKTMRTIIKNWKTTI